MHVLLLPLHPQETKIHPRQRHETFVPENKIRAGALLMVSQDHPFPRKFTTPDTPRGHHTSRNYPLLEKTETGSLRRGRHRLRAGEGIHANFPAAGPGFGVSCRYIASMFDRSTHLLPHWISTHGLACARQAITMSHVSSSTRIFSCFAQ